MKKRAIDLSFEELDLAGIKAGVSAAHESHEAGLVTLGKNAEGLLFEAHADGRVVIRARKDLETEMLPSAPKHIRRSSAA